MAKGNPLQEQLLKAGLVKKAKLAEVEREQHKARRTGGNAGPSEVRLQAEQTRIEKIERDRALAAERNAKARTAELRAQARQIIEDKKAPCSGNAEYRFTVDGAIRTLLVDDEQRRKLSSGAMVIARHGDGFALLPRAAGERVRERAAELIVLDHGDGGDTEAAAGVSDDDAYYAQFKVPDDLLW